MGITPQYVTHVIFRICDFGELIFEQYEQLLGAHTKLVAISHISNALGTINPVKKIIALAHKHDAIVLVDGAQAIPHCAVDVRALDCDFYCFSGHKLFGPTGTGVLYGKRALLEAMPPRMPQPSIVSSVVVRYGANPAGLLMSRVMPCESPKKPTLTGRANGGCGFGVGDGFAVVEPATGLDGLGFAEMVGVGGARLMLIVVCGP